MYDIKLVSINIGKEQAIAGAKSSGVSGIFKQPQHRSITVTTLGLEGDCISDTKHHGGVDQAIYVYTTDDYSWWEEELGQELAAGTFGENITLSGLTSEEMCVGDRIHIDDVVLEVTDARIPCVTLAARMGDPTFVKRFRIAERPGAYCRVITSGTITPDSIVKITPYPGTKYPVLEGFRLFFKEDVTESDLRRALAVPISVRARQSLEKKLQDLLSQSE